MHILLKCPMGPSPAPYPRPPFPEKRKWWGIYSSSLSHKCHVFLSDGTWPTPPYQMCFCCLRLGAIHWASPAFQTHTFIDSSLHGHTLDLGRESAIQKIGISAMRGRNIDGSLVPSRATRHIGPDFRPPRFRRSGSFLPGHAAQVPRLRTHFQRSTLPKPFA